MERLGGRLAHQTLFMDFAQWQGAGADSRIGHGAAWLRQHLPFKADVMVPVPADGPLETAYGVIGHAPILAQLTQASRLLATHQPARVFTLGGDCGVEVAPVAWLNRYYNGDLAVVWLDAHADLNTPETSPSHLFHGMPLRTLLGDTPQGFSALIPEPLFPSQVFLAGVRDTDPAEQQFIQQHQVFCLPVSAASEAVSLLQAAIAGQGFRHVYIHVDLDVLDPEVFPHVACPTAGGLGWDTLDAIVTGLQTHFTVVGASVLECTASQHDTPEAVWMPILREVLSVRPA